MRAVRYHGRGDVRLDELPEPTPRAGEVLLRVAYNGLCGSDVHEYVDGPAAVTVAPHPLTGCSLPCVLGHEFSGWVVDPDDVTGLDVGDLVAVEPIETCGRCPRCRSGRRHLCRQLAFHGYNRDGGGLAERTVVRADMVHRLPAGFSPLLGALVEPMAVSRHAVRRSRARAGDLAVVHGAGPIGLGALVALTVEGADVVVVDPSPTRRQAAVALGASSVVDPGATDVVEVVRDLTGGLGAACSIDAAGVGSALTTAIRSTRPDGIVVMVAHHRQPYPLRSGSVIFGEVTITGSLIYEPGDFDWVIETMGRGGYRPEHWVSVIDLGRVVDDGLEPLRAQSVNKVVVDVAGGQSPGTIRDER